MTWFWPSIEPIASPMPSRYAKAYASDAGNNAALNMQSKRLKIDLLADAIVTFYINFTFEY